MKKSTQPAPQKVKSAQVSNTKIHQRGYRDLHEHLAELDKQGLLVTIDRPINKDTELHPLVRWQFRGGIAEPDRKAFLFTNVVNGKGKKYD
ncbi:MAG: 3-octaprenyl-4-hydroxybenzoate carboxy-lyase, partial [Pseudomonadota bacterium]